MISKETAQTTFQQLFQQEPSLFYAPGRVNLIGEHTDYNDGFVLPIAIDKGVLIAISPRTDQTIEVVSQNLNERLSFSLDDPPNLQRKNWLSYIEGVARGLLQRGAPLSGANLLVMSDLPSGAGLSSSAALEVSVALSLSTLSGITLDRTELALLCQQAEHDFVGVKCGIMDQMAAALSERDHALLIDCRTLDAQKIPLFLGDAKIILCDTGVKHSLAASAYNQRREECERGVELLKEFYPEIKALRDLTPDQVHQAKSSLPGVVYQRCHHVVEENARVPKAAAAFARGDLGEAGYLMYRSHVSLRVDYQVSCPELDCIVDTAQQTPGVYGARMTGGGFGGCAIALVREAAVLSYQSEVTKAFETRFHRAPRFFTAVSSDGAQQLHPSLK